MITLVAEIGNTNIMIAVHDGTSWIHKFRYETKGSQPNVFFEVGLRDLLLEWNIQPQHIDRVGLSSVVPEVNDQIINALIQNTRQSPIILTPELFSSMDMHVPQPYEIGADIVANTYAALKKTDSDCIIADFGTALTFAIVTKENGIEGVTIAPGIMTAIKALSANTSLLPEVDLVMPESVIGIDTDTAMRAGVLYGYVGLVKEIIEQIKKERPRNYTIIASGGLSTIIKPLIDYFDIVDKELTIDGIRMIINDGFPISLD